MKNLTAIIVFLGSLGSGCGLDTAGLGDLSHQPGSTGSQHTEAGANVDVGDASVPPIADAQATDAAIAIDAATATGCSAGSCSVGAVCCAQDLGGGMTATMCAPDCHGVGKVVCDPGGAPCADGDCQSDGKFPGLRTCN